MSLKAGNSYFWEGKFDKALAEYQKIDKTSPLRRHAEFNIKQAKQRKLSSKTASAATSLQESQPYFWARQAEKALEKIERLRRADGSANDIIVAVPRGGTDWQALSRPDAYWAFQTRQLLEEIEHIQSSEHMDGAA